MRKSTRIFVAGHLGMVGSAICRNLESKSFENIIGQSSKDLDLRSQKDCDRFFDEMRPEVVIDAAARVGGILANNNYPYQFLMDNMQIQNNLLEAALKYDVKKFIFLGSSCIYPKMAPQPITEDSLLTAPLEPTNEAYALAKITGVKACEFIRRQFGKDFVSLMPTNLYGSRDNFDVETSHVLPAMIRKFHDAKIQGTPAVTLWGTGAPLREFLHVKDLAEAVYFALENTLPDYLYNVGSGSEISIKELATLVKNTIGYTGEIIWDSTKPDGTPRKLMDSSKMNTLGWKPSVSLEEGIASTYQWFLNNESQIKEVKF